MGVSTLSTWLVGTKLKGKTIRAVSYDDRRSPFRLVEINSHGETMSIPVLQDLLLLAKGYPQGKYSGLGVAELQALREPPRRERRTRRRRA